MIKVTTGGEPIRKEKKDFPKLMISCDGRKPEWIVEVHKKEGKFIAIHRDSPYANTISLDFNLRDDFTDYNEPVTIQNV